MSHSTRVRCATHDCPEQIDLLLSTEVYGAADPFETPTPITDTARTGWGTLRGTHHFCPTHLSVERAKAVFAHLEWTSRRDEVQAQLAREMEAWLSRWTAENAPPVPDWRSSWPIPPSDGDTAKDDL